MTTPTYPARRRQQVERASMEWRSALIDVSGNNRLLFFRPTAATLDLDGAAEPALAELLAGGTVRLSRLFTEPARLTAAQRACKSLAAKQREAAEEYGVSVAFLALGIATWSRNPDDASGEVAVDATTGEITPDGGGEDGAPTGRGRRARALGPVPPAAPVLLRSVELTHRPGALDAWEITLGGDAHLNPVLLHVLSAQGVQIDEETALDAGDDTRGELTPIYDHLRKECADVAGFAVEERTLLGPFSYLKQPMVADCEDVEALLGSDLVAALAGDEDAIAAVRAQVGDVTDADPDYRPVESEYLVLDADASQSYVVNAALAGRNLVVQGPPGTGKSQTIANVIAGLMAEGKRVLFVAQKRAAITAVLDRLGARGLGELTLDLFAAGASRRYVAEQLREVLDRQTTVGAPVTAALHRRLTEARDRLVGHRNALHTRTHAWGVTVAELLAASYALPRDVRTPLRLPAATLARWAGADLDAHAAALGELTGKGGLDPERLTRPGWSVTTLTTTEAVAAANQALVALQGELAPAAAETIGSLSRELGVVEPHTMTDAAQLLAEAAEAAELSTVAPGALDPGLDPAGLERLLSSTDRTYRKAHGPDLGWLERRRARKDAHALLPSASPEGVHELLRRAKDARTAWAHRGAAGPVRAATSLGAAQEALAALRDGLRRLEPALQNLPLDTVALPDLPRVLDGLAADRSRAQLPRLHELEVALASAGCTPLLTTLRRQAGTDEDTVGRDPERAADVLRYAAVHSALDHAMTTDPALASTDGTELDAAVAEFQERDVDHLAANAARVRRAAAARLSQVLDAEPAQHLTVKREVTRKRNFKAVRALFDEAPDVMTAIKPCWAMSPLQVSRLLPAAACFDVVIFDEASQVKPADAVPALVRAPQAIVAGDSRQLPPTEFFTKVLDDVPTGAAPSGHDAAAEAQDALAAEADAEDAALDATAPPPEPVREPGESFTRDAESILFALDRVLAGQSRRLLWHYRSRDERLIAVSNAYVYDGSLTTFPAADGHDCLRHEVVPPSPGIKDGANSPALEVRRVVDLVVEHARTRPGETLGVIAFGVAHANRIEAALEAAFAAEPHLEAALVADAREPFFVKNIERVQGDERDSIILSVGYGKAADGRMRYFWGPLLTEGGERRLNVAISRARSRLTLVTSFSADDVPEDAHSSAGFALMYRFLRFMASGGTELTGGADRDRALNPFEVDVRDRLTAAGLDLVPQLGVGSYRLDFAVRHPDHPGRYVLAIEADGANYHAGHIARERDRLRQRLLEGRGWTFHRIWSTDWFDDPAGEVAAAVAALHAAVAADTRADGPDDPDIPGLADDPDLADDPGLPDDPGDRDVPAPAASWHIAEAQRTVPRPPLVAGQPINRYEPSTLVRLVRHVRSDGVLRTREEELMVLIRELGFTKRGSRLVAALTAAQDAAGPAQTPRSADERGGP
ncbi:MAG TPA: AAA domain-containing protein [Mycobacteriales bacterium]|nr:AAA domain-containing protein [Mycobacteriales bacterium]